VFNRAGNIVLRRSAEFMLKKYADYPSATTALLLIDVQKALTAGQGIDEPIRQLVAICRRHGILIVYSNLAADKEPHFPVPAQSVMRERLNRVVDGHANPEFAQPHVGDILLPARTTLSAFAGSTLESTLRERGIEHLVIAGPFANIGPDSTGREGVELGFHITMLSDCTSAETAEELRAAVQITWPRFAQTVLTLDAFASRIH
jgi:nicotinamidase-related amidase